MPPPDSDDALTADEVTLVRAWIAQGAEWSEHWAFTAPKRPEPPGTNNNPWVRNGIDAFVLDRLQREGLAPSTTADRLTLLRRLSLDLTGLPPSLEEADRVLQDNSDHWYDQAVKRLLASPHYGEHWARHWMDAAQYADSDGFEKDKPRQVWAWRDWVIQSFNENKSFNAFVTEQVAGDLLVDATQDQRVATGFLRNSMVNEEGGIDPEQFRMEAMFNRMDLIGRAVLGLTINCAQCHSHKYDPLSQDEYYGMFAFLNNAHEACEAVYSEKDVVQRDALLKMIEDLEAGLKDSKVDWLEKMTAWSVGIQNDAEADWETLTLEFDDSTAGGQKCLPQNDGSYLAQGYAPTRHSPRMTATTTLPKITAVRLELLPDANLPRNGPGRSIFGACALSEIHLRYTTDDLPIAKFNDWETTTFESAIADVNPPQRILGNAFPERDKAETRTTGPVSLAIDGKDETAWTTDIDPGRRNQARYAIFKLKEPLTIKPDMRLAIVTAQRHGGWNSDDSQNNNIGRFRISVTDSEALPSVAIPAAVKEAAKAAPEVRTPEDLATLFNYWRRSVPEFELVNARIDALWDAHPDGTTQLVLHERVSPRETRRLVRGDFLSPAEPVTRSTPAFLHPLDVKKAPSRLDFAKWLTSDESPTTARAYVNRVWQRYFGNGIVATTDDLGKQGDRPSHPELLDWLAVTFMESGWDVKNLHRTIVMSATYRQQSPVSPDLLDRDPNNVLLARGARFRVEGETVRDIALAASGLMNDRVGGPSVHPPAPEFLFKPPASYGPKTWGQERGPNDFRRALYTFRFRSVPYPALQVFDVPAGDAPCTRRDRSNSPLQALTALNEELYFDAARALAKETLAFSGDDRTKAAFAFRRCVTRAPAADEIDTVLVFLDAQRARIASGELAASQIAASDSDAPELAAWTLAARVLLNLDETIVKQ
jgi:hypothetical protein